MPNISDLYSTVNKLNKSQPKLNNDEEIPAQQAPHVPIYDSTTNLQHQRINLLNNRSKTPGPDTIYFRNTNTTDFPPVQAQSRYQNIKNQNKSATISAATGNQQFNYMSRSKTPTADIMYYPMSANNNSTNFNSSVSSSALNKRAQMANFENIYQPFNVNSNQLNENEDYLDSVSYNLNQCNQQLVQQLISNQINSITSDVDGNYYVEMVVDLYRQESGFGFRIVGGEEEGSQVAVGYIVNGGAAHLDSRLKPNDEIIMIDNECVLGATHRRVVQLMTIAGLNRKVKLMVRRKISNQQYKMLVAQQKAQQQQRQQNGQSPVGGQQQQQQQQQAYPYTITLFRNGNEGFGFVIISTLNKNGPSIGMRIFFMFKF